MQQKREKPNILITGTPGVGKSYLCSKLVDELKFEWHDVSKIAKKEGFTEEYDKEYECPTLDEEKLLDYLEPHMSKGGNIVEYHGCEFFPERWFDVIFVVRCNNTVLYDRLIERQYNQKKVQSNIECEIFQVILQEAMDSYDENIVFEIKSETPTDLEDSLNFIKNWYKKWEQK